MNLLNFHYERLPAFSQVLATQDQEARIRKALGLNRGPLPKIKAEWLQRYHEYLSAELKFPFFARYVEETSPNREPVAHDAEVFALVHPSEMAELENTALLCRIMRNVCEEEVPLVDLEVDDAHPNFQLLEDYWYWIWNWRFDPGI